MSCDQTTMTSDQVRTSMRMPSFCRTLLAAPSAATR